MNAKEITCEVRERRSSLRPTNSAALVGGIVKLLIPNLKLLTGAGPDVLAKTII